jgi:hypothetical protein
MVVSQAMNFGQGSVRRWIHKTVNAVITGPLDSGSVAVVEQGTPDVTIAGPLSSGSVAVEEQGTLSAAITGPLDSATGAVETIDYAHHEIHGGSHFYIQGGVTLQNTDTWYATILTHDSAKWMHFLFAIKSTGILATTLDEDAVVAAGGLRSTIHANNRNTSCWTGSHTGAGNAAVLTDSAQAWTPDALIGLQVFNGTDSSSGFITANTANTVTATLAGGTDNDWDAGDKYEINKSLAIFTGNTAVASAYTQRLEAESWGADGFKETIGGGTGREDEFVLKQNAKYQRAFTSGANDNYVQFKASWYEHTHS